MPQGYVGRAARSAVVTLLTMALAGVALELFVIPNVAATTPPALIRRLVLTMAALLASAATFFLSLRVQRDQDRAQAASRRELEAHVHLLQRQIDHTERVAQIGSWEWRLDEGDVSWSDEMFHIVGVERGSFRPTWEDYLRRLPSEDRESVRRAIRQAESGEPFELEHRVLRPDGEVRTVVERGAVLADGPRRMIGTTQDVTDLKTLEGRLHMRREIYMSLLEAQSDLGQGALMTEGDRIIYLNRAIQQVLAQQPSEKESLPDLLGAIDPAGSSTLRREFEVRRNRALPPAQGEDRLALANGPVIDVEFSIDSISLGDQLRTVALVRDVTQRKAADTELRRTRERLRVFSLELARVREEESTRIAREIHDELGQRLTGLKMDLAWVAARLRRDDSQRDLPAVTEKIEEMSGLADDTIQEVRRIATELRPGVLDDLGFAAALDWQCQEFSRRTGIPCQVLAPADVAISDEVSTALFRITQEALTNITRHARASKVHVRLTDEEDSVVLEIEDDGRGLPSSTDTASFGLLGMAERARLVGGVAFVGPAPERGTIVLVKVPKKLADANEVSP